MTTHRIVPNYYYAPNENVNESNRWKNYVHSNPHNRGSVTSRSRQGQYNITEKEFGDQKLLYYVPTEYGNDYDISQLDEPPIYEEQQKYYSPTILRRRYYRQFDDDYVEDLPMISPRRHIYVSPRRSQVIRRSYYEAPPPVDYVYEDDYTQENEEIIGYIVRERVPRQTYVEELPPVRRSVHVENAPPPPPSPSPPSPPHRSLHNVITSRQLSPRISPLPIHVNEFSSPRSSKMKQQTPRATIYEPQKRLTVPRNNAQNYLSLKSVLAQNRAKRGSRIPKPRREVDEENLHDLPTYNKNLIKNGFIVHK